MHIMNIVEKIKGTIVNGVPEPHFTVFDFDNTYIENDIQEAMLGYLCRHDLLRNPALAEVSLTNDRGAYHEAVFRNYHKLLEKNDVLEAYRYAIRTLAGFSIKEVKEFTLKTINDEGEVIMETELFGIKIAKGLRIRKSVKKLAEEMNTLGVNIWIISASFQPVVATALHHYKLLGECIGINLVEKDGVFADVFVEPLSILEGKVDCIKQFIHPSVRPLLGVGDSMNDLPMLEYSQTKVVVDRGNALAEKAKEEGWRIIQNEV